MQQNAGNLAPVFKDIQMGQEDLKACGSDEIQGFQQNALWIFRQRKETAKQQGKRYGHRDQRMPPKTVIPKDVNAAAGQHKEVDRAENCSDPKADGKRSFGVFFFCQFIAACHIHAEKKSRDPDKGDQKIPVSEIAVGRDPGDGTQNPAGS